MAQTTIFRFHWDKSRKIHKRNRIKAQSSGHNWCPPRISEKLNGWSGWGQPRFKFSEVKIRKNSRVKQFQKIWYDEFVRLQNVYTLKNGLIPQNLCQPLGVHVPQTKIWAGMLYYPCWRGHSKSSIICHYPGYGMVPKLQQVIVTFAQHVNM